MTTQTALLIGANRGLGLGLAREYLSREWNVIATARKPESATELHALAGESGGRLRAETADVTVPESGRALAGRLEGTKLDLLFIVAGRNVDHHAPIHAVSPQDAAQEFMTNSYGPPVMAEALSGLLNGGAPVVFMTSVLGSLARSQGSPELYSASKSALNMLGIAFSKRHPDRRTILMHPGWVRTDMGGADAPLDVPTSARGMADTIARQAGKTGVIYLDYAGREIPW